MSALKKNEPDEFLTIAGKGAVFLAKHRSLALGIFFILLGLSVVFLFIGSSREKNLVESESRLHALGEKPTVDQVSEFLKSASKTPQAGEALWKVLPDLLQKQQWEQALGLINQLAPAKTPQALALRYAKAQVLWQLKKGDEALAELTDAGFFNEESPYYAYALFIKAHLLLDQQKKDEAMVVLRSLEVLDTAPSMHAQVQWLLN